MQEHCVISKGAQSDEAAKATIAPLSPGATPATVARATPVQVGALVKHLNSYPAKFTSGIVDSASARRASLKFSSTIEPLR